MKSTDRFISLIAVLALVFVLAAQQARASLTLDAFSDGGVVLNVPSSGIVVGSEGPSSALGGWRALNFNSGFSSSMLTLDDTAGTLRISGGLGQATLGYGLRLTHTGGGMVGELPNALNADLTDYLGLRFNIVENPIIGSDTRMLLTVSLRTIGGGISAINQFGRGILPTSGSFDLLFADIGGSVDLADVDFISIRIQNGTVGNSVEIGPIELIPDTASGVVPEPASLAVWLAMISCCWRWLAARRDV